MAKREERSTASNFARGAELWWHQTRLFGVAVLGLVVLSFVIGLAAGVVYFFKASSPVERYALERNLMAEVREAVPSANRKMELYLNGIPMMLEFKRVIELTEDEANEGSRHLKNAALIGSLVWAGFFFFVAMYWWQYGRGKMTDERLRGASLVEGKQLKQMIEARDDGRCYGCLPAYGQGRQTVERDGFEQPFIRK